MSCTNPKIANVTMKDSPLSAKVGMAHMCSSQSNGLVKECESSSWKKKTEAYTLSLIYSVWLFTKGSERKNERKVHIFKKNAKSILYIIAHYNINRSLSVSSFHSTKDKREVTTVFYGVETVINTVVQFLDQTRSTVYACVDQTRPILTLDILLLKNAFLDAKRRGVKLLYITEITKDNLSYCRQLMPMVDELRHLD